MTATVTRIVRPAWEPIATAPKDGTPILVLSPSLGHVIVRWSDGPVAWCKTSWCTWWDGTALAREPTHWMPLPPPPDAPQEDR